MGRVICPEGGFQLLQELLRQQRRIPAALELLDDLPLFLDRPLAPFDLLPDRRELLFVGHCHWWRSLPVESGTYGSGNCSHANEAAKLCAAQASAFEGRLPREIGFVDLSTKDRGPQYAQNMYIVVGLAIYLAIGIAMEGVVGLKAKLPEPTRPRQLPMP